MTTISTTSSKTLRTKDDIHDKKVVLMVRNPADTAVSQYYQWKFRMTARKKRINNYPLDRQRFVHRLRAVAGERTSEDHRLHERLGARAQPTSVTC